MDACYYCGAPLKQGAAACRFCGSVVDPLDVPLCDSENSTLFDEAPVLQLCDVEYPPLLSFDEIQTESGMETETIGSSKVKAETMAPEGLPDKPKSVIEMPEAVSGEQEITPENPETEPAVIDAISEESDIILEKPKVESKELDTVSEELGIASGEVDETEVSLEDDVDQPSVVLEVAPPSDTGVKEPLEIAEKELNPDLLFSINTLSGQDRACVIVKYIGSPVDFLRIPDEIDGQKVKRIGRSAFAHCMIRQIALPDSLQHIDDYAFTGCIGLQSIFGGTGIREIGRGIFNGCLNLKKCDFLKNRRIHRPFDSFMDRIISQLSASEKTDNGEYNE